MLVADLTANLHRTIVRTDVRLVPGCRHYRKQPQQNKAHCDRVTQAPFGAEKLAPPWAESVASYRVPPISAFGGINAGIIVMVLTACGIH